MPIKVIHNKIQWNNLALEGSRRCLNSSPGIGQLQDKMQALCTGNREAHILYVLMIRPEGHKFITAEICTGCGMNLNKYLPFFEFDMCYGNIYVYPYIGSVPDHWQFWERYIPK